MFFSRKTLAFKEKGFQPKFVTNTPYETSFLRSLIAYLTNQKVYCSESTLTGESRFHISTPLGIEPRSLMAGSKRVDHWTSGTMYECSEIAGSPQGSSPAADYVGCEAARRICSKHEARTGELCEIKWDYHIVGTRG